MRSNFKVVVGVDQTGAKGPGGKAKPLPASLLISLGKNWSLKTPLYLMSFDRESIVDLLSQYDVRCKWSEVLVLADCVLGIPKNVMENRSPLEKIHKLMDAAAKHPGVGLNSGESFFKSEFPDLGPHQLLRVQEKDLRCLSVFKNKPFQRNVQTGTYRIWGDLGLNRNYLNFNIWPYEKNKDRAYLCEGYPAHAKAMVAKYKKLPVENFHLFDEVGKDHKDAAALALLGGLFFDPSDEIKDQTEGLILVGQQKEKNEDN